MGEAMELMPIVDAALFAGAGLLAVACFLVGNRILWSDSCEYRKNRQRTKSLYHVIRGELPTQFEGGRDYRVRAGLAVDRKRNVWVEQGILSEEALDAVLGKPAAGH